MLGGMTGLVEEIGAVFSELDWLVDEEFWLGEGREKFSMDEEEAVGIGGLEGGKIKDLY